MEILTENVFNLVLKYTVALYSKANGLQLRFKSISLESKDLRIAYFLDRAFIF